jgi:hypothetical protein
MVAVILESLTLRKAIAAKPTELVGGGKQNKRSRRRKCAGTLMHTNPLKF